MTDRRKFESAVYGLAVVATIASGTASTSFVQKNFGLEFGSASRILDRMCSEGVVSEELPDRTRVVLMSIDEWNGRSI